MTGHLLADAQSLTLVEGAAPFAKELAAKFPAAKVVCSLIEDFNTEEKFDTIVLGHVLEHVIDPVSILAHIKGLLSDDGIIFAAVPNSHSLHRQAAVIMGLIESEHVVGETGERIGHKRVYSMDGLYSDFVKAGLKVRSSGGYGLKLQTEAQIMKGCYTQEMMAAFYRLGESYPDIAQEIYVVASK